MADFAQGSASRGFGGSSKSEFKKVKVPPLKVRNSSPFWKLVMEVAKGYRNKINPKTHRKYTRDERLHIGMAVAGRTAARRRVH